MLRPPYLKSNIKVTPVQFRRVFAWGSLSVFGAACAASKLLYYSSLYTFYLLQKFAVCYFTILQIQLVGTQMTWVKKKGCEYSGFKCFDYARSGQRTSNKQKYVARKVFNFWKTTWEKKRLTSFKLCKMCC